MSSISIPVLQALNDDPDNQAAYGPRTYRLAQAALRRRRHINYQQFKEISGIRSSYIGRVLFEGLAGAGATVLPPERLAHFITLLDSELLDDKEAAAFLALRGSAAELTQRQFSKLLFSTLSMLEPERRKLVCRRLTYSFYQPDTGTVAQAELDAKDFSQRFRALHTLPGQLNSKQVNWLGKLRRRTEASTVQQWLGAPQQRQLLLWSAGYLLLCLVVFYLQAQSYRAAGADLAIQLARGAAACVNLGTALICLPMLRSLTTTLHRRLPHILMPYGALRSLHKLVGVSLLVFSLIHIAGQLAHQAALGHSLSTFLWQTALGITGIILLLVIAIMAGLGRQRFYRKPGRYAWFKFSHKLYWAWFGLMLWHSPQFWLWFLLPGLLFGINLLFQARRKSKLSCVVAMESAAEQITILQLQRPSGFQFRAGDYVYLRLPEIDRQQWHPFTLSSAPGQDKLTLHIRNAGLWTGQLHALARQTGSANLPMPAELDGPYSAPSAIAMRHDVIILVAGGIGITPFASLLRHITLQSQAGLRPVKQHVYVYWICRTPDAIAWIRPLLDELADSPAASWVSIKLFCSAVQRDLGDLALQLASEHYHLRHGRDALTDCRYPLLWGRPDWEQELDAILLAHPSHPPRMFFCGPTPFATELKAKCLPRRIPFSQEIF